MRAEIASVAPFSGGSTNRNAAVQRIRLQLEGAYAFQAGQYLSIHAGAAQVPLSIASSPHQLPLLELHYRSSPGSEDAAALDEALGGSHLEISAPMGDVFDAHPDEPLLFIAGGTGASQAFSIALAREGSGTQSLMEVAWLADVADDIYAEQALRNVGCSVRTFIDAKRDASNAGLTWLRQRAQTLGDTRVILGGSPGFVYTMTDALLEAGIAQDQMAADAYAYAPR